MLRLAVALAAASLAFPACAGTGFAELASLPPSKASSVLVTRGACALPAHPAADAGPVVPAPRSAMTLSPRMLEALRIEADWPAD
jgi:hypothetical protein